MERHPQIEGSFNVRHIHIIDARPELHWSIKKRLLGIPTATTSPALGRAVEDGNDEVDLLGSNRCLAASSHVVTAVLEMFGGDFPQEFLPRSCSTAGNRNVAVVLDLNFLVIVAAVSAPSPAIDE
jgi:hypothetical protein